MGPGWVVMGGVRKKAEKGMASKPVGIVPLSLSKVAAPGSCIGFLPQVLALTFFYDEMLLPESIK